MLTVDDVKELTLRFLFGDPTGPKASGPTGATSSASPKVRGRRQTSNSRPTRPIPPTAAAHGTHLTFASRSQTALRVSPAPPRRPASLAPSPPSAPPTTTSPPPTAATRGGACRLRFFRSGTCLCIHARPFAPPAAAAAAASLPRPRAWLACDASRPVWRVDAGRSDVAAPPPSAAPASRGGRRTARAGRNGRRTRALAASEGGVGCGSVGGVPRARGAPLAGRAAADGRPCGRSSRPSHRRDNARKWAVTVICEGATACLWACECCIHRPRCGCDGRCRKSGMKRF